MSLWWQALILALVENEPQDAAVGALLCFLSDSVCRGAKSRAYALFSGGWGLPGYPPPPPQVLCSGGNDRVCACAQGGCHLGRH